ncbi:hypothetical protein MMC20_004650 [Loxospora ochrophaea]|nr:hypothetical protein [Loxospora ochrophaea]
MPEPVLTPKPLLSYKLLSFDIYGTLIDWETSITTSLKPLISRLPPSSPYANLQTTPRGINELLSDCADNIEREQPRLRYDKLLHDAYLQLAQKLNIPLDDSIKTEASAFGASISSWLPFPDTILAMQRLKRHYRLVPLSNVDRASFNKTLSGPLSDVDFDTSYVAEEIGSYKPDHRNFEYLLSHVKSDFGINQDEVLHTANSLQHDHVPAKQIGIHSCWIARQGAGMGGEKEKLHKEGKVGYEYRFATLGELADAVEVEAEVAKAN